MPRARGLKPAFFEDGHLAKVSHTARCLLPAMWCLADRSGRMEYRLAKIRAFAFPYEPEINIEPLIAELEEVTSEYLPKGFVTTYEVNAKKYLQINNWGELQSPHHQESPSKLPPPDHLRTTSEEVQQEPGSNSPDTDTDTDKDSDPDSKPKKVKKPTPSALTSSVRAHKEKSLSPEARIFFETARGR